MANTLGNRVKMSVSGTPGTGTITLGSAVSGFQTFAQASIPNAATVPYIIEDGSNWEIGVGTYTSSGTTLARTTVTASSNSGSAISATSSAIVMISPLAADLQAAANLATGTSGGIPYFSSTSALSSSAALAANALVVGGGAGAAPSTITTGTGVVTGIGNAVNTNGGFITQAALTSYTPTISAQIGSLGTNPPTGAGRYVDVGNLRFVDVTVTFPSNYTSGSPTVTGSIQCTLPSTPVADVNNGVGREVAVVGSALQVLGFASVSFIRLVKFSDGTVVAGNSYQLNTQLWYRTA